MQAPNHPRQQDAGVTLVEILVVLVLVGIMSGVVGLSLGGNRQASTAGQEADLLVARLNRAADEAILTGEPFSFVWAQQTYKFMVQGENSWVPHPLPLLSTPHLLPDIVQISTAPGAVIISDQMLPDTGTALLLELATRGSNFEVVTFDGINAARQDRAL